MIIMNSFSLNMFQANRSNFEISIDLISAEQVQAIHQENPLESYIGHANTAIIISNLLNIEVPFNRQTFEFSEDIKQILVAQYKGERLPEGATTLPEHASILFYLITCH